MAARLHGRAQAPANTTMMRLSVQTSLSAPYASRSLAGMEPGVRAGSDRDCRRRAISSFLRRQAAAGDCALNTATPQRRLHAAGSAAFCTPAPCAELPRCRGHDLRCPNLGRTLRAGPDLWHPRASSPVWHPPGAHAAVEPAPGQRVGHHREALARAKHGRQGWLRVAAQPGAGAACLHRHRPWALNNACTLHRGGSPVAAKPQGPCTGCPPCTAHLVPGLKDAGVLLDVGLAPGQLHGLRRWRGQGRAGGSMEAAQNERGVQLRALATRVSTSRHAHMLILPACLPRLLDAPHHARCSQPARHQQGDKRHPAPPRRIPGSGPPG